MPLPIAEVLQSSLEAEYEVDEYIEPSDDTDEDATESDYIDALQDLGVDV